MSAVISCSRSPSPGVDQVSPAQEVRFMTAAGLFICTTAINQRRTPHPASQQRGHPSRPQPFGRGCRHHAAFTGRRQGIIISSTTRHVEFSVHDRPVASHQRRANIRSLAVVAV